MSKELVKKEEANLVVAPVERQGFEGIDKTTMTMPALKLLQITSPEVKDDEYEEYGFRAGNIVHALFLEKMPEVFVPIKMWDDKILFKPRNADEELKMQEEITAKFGVDPVDYKDETIICRAFDNQNGDRFGKCSECGLCAFEGSRKPYGNKNMNVLAVMEGQDLPVVIRFSGTSHKHGEKFKRLAYFTKDDLWGRKYKLVVTKKQKADLSWFEWAVMPKGIVVPEEREAYAKLYEQFKGETIEADDGEY